MSTNYAAADRPRKLPTEIRGVAWTRTRRTKVTSLTDSNVAALRCPACWLDIPNQTPVPYHADSTGITTCPASGQALTREKENA